MGDFTGRLSSLKVTVLLEDYAGYDSGLLAQHGISLLLEASDGSNLKTILFDSGQSAGPVLLNMGLLGKEPDNIDLLFLSHCHYDHTGGLVGILEASKKRRIPVIAHPAIYRPNYRVKPSFQPVGIGPDNKRDAVEKAGGEMILAREPLALMPGVVTTGEITARDDFEMKPTISLFTLENGKQVPDFMIDDISIIFNLAQGLVIVTGCSHAGIVSIVKTALNLTGIDNVAAVIGGFHLVDATQERIDQTIATLAKMNVDKIYTGHCTGLQAEAAMIWQMPDRFRKLRTGMKINF